MRTIQVLLESEAPDTSVTAKINGVTVYSGPINVDVNMFTFEVPIEFPGQKDLLITVDAGIIRVLGVRGNYAVFPNPVFTAEELKIVMAPDSNYTHQDLLDIKLPIYERRANPKLTPGQLSILKDEASTVEELDAVLLASNTTGVVSTGPTGFIIVNGLDEALSNVEIDGVPQLMPEDPAYGYWVYLVYEGSTLTAKINILRGIETATSLDLNPVL